MRLHVAIRMHSVIRHRDRDEEKEKENRLVMLEG